MRRMPIYYRVGDQESRSTTWQMWVHQTSFYLVNSALGGFKISLHGYDARHPGGEHFRAEVDSKHRRPGGSQLVTLVPPSAGWPVRFSGLQDREGALAVRIRCLPSAWELPSLPRPPSKKSSAVAAMPLPSQGWAAHLDLIFERVPAGFAVPDFSPYRFDLANPGVHLSVGMGSGHPMDRTGFMLTNDHGVVIRCETRNQRPDLYPTPAHLVHEPEDPAEATRRAIAIDVDEAGVLWIVEQAVARDFSQP